MASVNVQILVGNLGRDPEVRYSPNGQPKTEFSLATSRSWKKDDEWQEQTTWHNCVVWGEKAERVAEWARKGMQVYVQGRTENRSWDDEKTGQKKYKTEVIADTVYRLGRKEEGDAAFAPPAGDFGAPPPEGEFVGAPATPKPSGQPRYDDVDDLPF